MKIIDSVEIFLSLSACLSAYTASMIPNFHFSFEPSRLDDFFFIRRKENHTGLAPAKILILFSQQDYDAERAEQKQKHLKFFYLPFFFFFPPFPLPAHPLFCRFVFSSQFVPGSSSEPELTPNH